jgi:hypothetical protein
MPLSRTASITLPHVNILCSAKKMQQALDLLAQRIDPSRCIEEELGKAHGRCIVEEIELIPQEIHSLKFIEKVKRVARIGDLVLIYAAALLGKCQSEQAAQVLRQFIVVVQALDDKVRKLARICKIEGECKVLLCYCLAQEDQLVEALDLAASLSIPMTAEFAYFRAFCLFELTRYKEAVAVINEYVRSIEDSVTSETPVTADMFDLYANCLSLSGERSTSQIAFSNAISMSTEETDQIVHSYNKALHDLSIGSLHVSKRLLEMLSRVCTLL